MGRCPSLDKTSGLKKGPWTPEEDQKLLAYVQQNGHGSWRALPPKAGLQRCGKSCRLRWTNYLRPDIKRGKFTSQEEQTIIQLHALLGNRWSAIAAHLPKRTDNEIKNYWNTHIKKRLIKMGIDPVTHKPNNHALGCAGEPRGIANLSHIAQWESARLEAEARESKLVSNYPYQSQIRNILSTSKALPPPPPPPQLPCLDILKVWAWTNHVKAISSASTYCTPIPTDGSSNENENPFVTNINYQQGEVVNNIMGNAVELCGITSPIDCAYVGDSLGFSSLVEGFADLHPNIFSATGTSSSNIVEDFEENKINYSSNVMQNEVYNTPIGSPVF